MSRRLARLLLAWTVLALGTVPARAAEDQALHAHRKT